MGLAVGWSANSPLQFSEAFALNESRVLLESDDDRRVHYGEVLSLADSPMMRDASGRLVFCMCDNDVDSLRGYLALLCAGAIPLMLAPSTPDAQRAVMLDKYRPGFVWCHRSSVELFPHPVVVGEVGDYRLVSLGPADYPVDDRLALLLSTSGSTGSPKYVRLSHQNVLSNAVSIAEYLQLGEDEIAITSLPPHYSYGLSVIHSHAMVGAKIAVTASGILDKAFWPYFESSGTTSFAGVPYQYEMLRKFRFMRKSYPRLRMMTQAGGRLQPEITAEFAQYCQSAGIRYYTMYGQSEASPRISYLDPPKASQKPGSIGQAIPGGRLWLEDEQGSEIAETDTSGELVYAGPNVAMGYAEGLADLALGDLWGGVLRTGDLARRDAEGDYAIVGRLKRFIKLFGHRTNLQDIEDTVAELGFHVACSGEDDRLEIYAPGIEPDDAERVKVSVCRSLGVPPTAVKVFRVDELPRNESGKLSYERLRSMPGEALA